MMAFGSRMRALWVLGLVIRAGANSGSLRRVFHPASAPSRGLSTSTFSGQHRAASLECVALQSPPGQAESAPNRSISAKNSMKSPGRTGLAFMKYWCVSRVKPVHMKTLSTSCTWRSASRDGHPGMAGKRARQVGVAAVMIFGAAEQSCV